MRCGNHREAAEERFGARYGHGGIGDCWFHSHGRHRDPGSDAQLKKFYFDTVLYNQEGLDLLFRIVGTDRCMFGTENPGTGSYKDPGSGKMLDDLKPVIEGIPSLSGQDRKNVFEDVAKKGFTRFEA